MQIGIPRGAQAITERIAMYQDAGVDELIFDPTVADLRQVDLLAEAVF